MAGAGRLAGKVAIATGAGSRAQGGIGNGRATAVLFAREGACVTLVDAVHAWVEELRQLIEAEGGQWCGMPSHPLAVTRDGLFGRRRG